MSLGASSLRQLDTCHPKLQRLLREVDARLTRKRKMDFTVLCGHRGEADQEQAFADGHSTKHWPDSKHNVLPSVAVDIAPYPIDWKDTEGFATLAGYVLAVADDLDIDVNWGGRWQRPHDLPHIELTSLELGRP